MGNTPKGARKAARTRKKIYGKECHQEWGKKGGSTLWDRIRSGEYKGSP